MHEFGAPAFCKIDVEGYEREALLGLSQGLSCLSFELAPAAPDMATACVDRLLALGAYRFNFSPGESLRWRWPQWVGADTLRSWMATLDVDDPSGDIYARRGDIETLTADFIRYLAAKRTVDDRALNRGVWEALAQALPGERAVDVLELGAGIGTMIERCLDWHLLNHARYTALDADPGHLVAAQARLQGWAERQGWQVEAVRPGELHLEGDGRRFDIEFEGADAFAYAESNRGRRAWDLLIAHAFLDLVDIPAVLPALLALLRPGGLFYFTITFDGVTSFQPEIDPDFRRPGGNTLPRNDGPAFDRWPAVGRQPFRAPSLRTPAGSAGHSSGRGCFRLGCLPAERALHRR